MCFGNLRCIIESYDIETKKFEVIHNGCSFEENSTEKNLLQIPLHEFIETIEFFKKMGYGVTITEGEGNKIINSLKELLVFETIHTKLYIGISQKGFN